jgi:7,8-dihydroneopterin aldolase/epimerase/oxygenase
VTGPTTRMAILVSDLQVSTSVGVHAHERANKQRLHIDLEFAVGPPKSDRLAETVDYQHITSLVEGIAEAGHIQLIETFAERVALKILEDTKVYNIFVKVQKPGAISTAEAACVTLFMERS